MANNNILSALEQLKKKALEYHSLGHPGKFGTRILKPLTTREHFGLSYTPGVAYACTAIAEDENKAYELTSKGNVVAVISNGTAVLGLGDIGAIAGKPVMEGKAILFKYLAGIDAIDIEIDLHDTNKIIEFIKAISPTIGGINLEDVAAPECFDIDKAVHNELGIPFFHDDQSGTAVVVAAAIQSALKITKKDIANCKIVFSGAGAAALACADLLVEVGANIKNFYVFDSKGLIHAGRQLDSNKARFAQPTDATIQEALNNADIFIGLSRADLLTADDIMPMAANPVILAMANPTPEISPVVAKEARSDAIVGSGRSDFVNQVNNVLCFPFLFRGALDIRAKSITLGMQLACCNALMEAAQANKNFGPDNIMPDAFDPSIIYIASKAVAQAAIRDGVAQKELPENYNDFLDDLVYGSMIDKTCCHPELGNAQANALIKILEAHNITKKSNRKLFVLSKEEIIEKAKDIKSCTIILENNIEIGFNNLAKLQTTDLISTLENTNFIGLVTATDSLFNHSHRIWYAHKLMRCEYDTKE